MSTPTKPHQVRNGWFFITAGGTFAGPYKTEAKASSVRKQQIAHDRKWAAYWRKA